MSDAAPTTLFTSESVTEGHPDKLCDAVADAILDDVLAHDPNARSAVEVATTTGFVLVLGEVTTTHYVDVPDVVRRTVREIGYNDSRLGFDWETCGTMTAIKEQSPDIARGVDHALESREGTDPDETGAGDQGMMFGYATDESDELMPMPILLAHRVARRLAEVRHDGTLPFLRPDGKSQVTIEYDADGRPLRVHTVLVSTQHDPDVDMAELAAAVRAAGRRGGGAGRAARRRDAAPRQPDRPLRHRRTAGRLGPVGAQDHRRHLRRHGSPRRRLVQWQGPDEGRPIRGVHGALRGEEHRRGGARAALRAAARLRHRRRAAARHQRPDLRHRRSCPTRAWRRSSTRPSTSVRTRSSATSTCAARSTAAPPPMATSGAPISTCRGSAPTAPATCATSPAADREPSGVTTPHAHSHARTRPAWGEPPPGPVARLRRRIAAILGGRPVAGRPTALPELPLVLRRSAVAAPYLDAERRRDHPAAGAAAASASERAIAAAEWWPADAWAHRALWHYEQAQMALEATHQARRIGDLRVAAGDPATARRYYAEAIDEARDIGAEREQGLAALGLGRAQLDLGDVTVARRLASAAITLLERAEAPAAEIDMARGLLGTEVAVGEGTEEAR